MSSRLYDALVALSTVREGLLLRREDGKALTDSHAHEVLYRTCRLAKLPERGWHILRHSFATHAALFAINPWTLNGWLGHKTMTETMRYVHVAQHHRRVLPPVVQAAGQGQRDDEHRVLALLAARGAIDWRGNSMATTGSRLRK